jgi:predicted RNA-binding protein with PUA-like domain
MAWWLMKSEPDVYGIEDLEREGENMWEGCRNYTVRNFFRDSFKVGDLAIFYHSNASPSGAAGVMEIVRTGYPDPTQFDPTSEYYDPKAKQEEPRWLVVDVKFVSKFPRIVPLAEIKSDPVLGKMQVCMRGQRLSVMPVEQDEFDRLLELAQQNP